MLTRDGYCIREIKMRIAMTKGAINRKISFVKLVRWYIWRTLINFERKCLKICEMCCWRRMEKVKWSEKAANKEIIKSIGEKWALLNIILRKNKQLGYSYSKKNCPCTWCQWKTDNRSELKRKKKKKNSAADDLRNWRKYWQLEEAEDRKMWKRALITWK